MLANQIGVRCDGLDGPAQAAPNFMFELAFTLARQHICHIYAPAVDAERGLEPVARYRIFVGVHLFAQAHAAIVEFGKAAYPMPGFVIIWMLVEGEKFG